MVDMASVALFHSVYGLRPAVRWAAERLRAAGHQVVAPDLYQAAAVDSIDEGFLLAENAGWENLLDRARAAVSVLPPDAVLAGFSMGSGLAEALLAERPEAAGMLLFAGAGPAEVPAGTRVQLHLADPDDFVPSADLHAWIEGMTRSDALFEVFRYPGVGHLWLDHGLPDHDVLATELTWQRCLEFLRLS
jgi:dienelactone hydrolase